jgi:NAD-dependent deacetylase
LDTPKVVKILDNTQRLLVVTGAGISKPCGIPTYRGPGGIYEQDPGIGSKLTIEEFESNPQYVWSRISELRRLVSEAKPSLAHQVLAEWEGSGRFSDMLIATQNIDGLHIEAGSKNVTELHGNVWEVCKNKVESNVCFADEFLEYEENVESKLDQIKRCSRENERDVWVDRSIPANTQDPNVRPNILLFNESYGTRLLWLEHFIKEGCDTVIFIGCSAGVGLQQMVKGKLPEAKMIFVNPFERPGVEVDVDLACGADEVMGIISRQWDL